MRCTPIIGTQLLFFIIPFVCFGAIEMTMDFFFSNLISSPKNGGGRKTRRPAAADQLPVFVTILITTTYTSYPSGPEEEPAGRGK